jgi:hypothetical protein
LAGGQLYGASLTNASLDGARMHGATLTNATLTGANLTRTHLQGSQINSANLDGARLDYAGLDGASLRSASAVAANFLGAKIRGTDFTFATLYGTGFDYTLAQNAIFNGAQLQGASMKGSRFDGASFVGAAVFGTDLTEADFKTAYVKNVLTEYRWDRDYSYWVSTYGPPDDPFGKPDDSMRPSVGDYSEPIVSYESSDYFATYKAITQSEIDSLIADVSKRASSEVEREVKARLTRLASEAATSNWRKLVDQSTSEMEFVELLRYRFEIIACASAGGIDVIRGLIRNKLICPMSEGIEQAAETGRRSDGAMCENKDVLMAARDEWSNCPEKTMAQ